MPFRHSSFHFSSDIIFLLHATLSLRHFIIFISLPSFHAMLIFAMPFRHFYCSILLMPLIAPLFSLFAPCATFSAFSHAIDYFSRLRRWCFRIIWLRCRHMMLTLRHCFHDTYAILRFTCLPFTIFIFISHYFLFAFDYFSYFRRHFIFAAIADLILITPAGFTLSFSPERRHYAAISLLPPLLHFIAVITDFSYFFGFCFSLSMPLAITCRHYAMIFSSSFFMPHYSSLSFSFSMPHPLMMRD
jgi:hypothetical protein